MEEKLYIDRALAEGFDNAAVMDTKDMVFDSSLRRYCEENLCGNYGKIMAVRRIAGHLSR